MPATPVVASYVAATATILNAASLSDTVELYAGRPARISMPAAWDAAAITIQVRGADGTFRNLYDAAGNEYTLQAAAGREIFFPTSDLRNIGNAIKLRSGTSGAPVPQTADRAISVIIMADRP